MKKIFIAIASYRDPECQWTVQHLFQMAQHPERLAVGVCWQHDPEQDQAFFAVASPFPERTKFQHVHYKDSRGACWAKAQALAMRTDEDYVLLIDSHMRFAQGWDQAMIDLLDSTQDERAFLSTYPAGYEPPDKLRFSTPRLAPVKFFDKVMSMNSVLLEMPKAMPSYLVAGGYLFGHSAMFDEVEYDPYIYFIGEEITHAARLFTHGWNGYTPHQCLIHHYYTRKDSSKHWQDQPESWGKINTASYKRVRHILGIERTADSDALQEVKHYGLGRQRTLDEFQARIGVNFHGQVIDRFKYDTLAAVEKAVAAPQPPQRSLETAEIEIGLCKFGYLMFPKQDAYIGKSLREYGEWRDGLNTALADLVPAGARVIEVGAGFGAHSMVLSKLVGAEGKLVCVEQSRKHTDLLHGNLALNACSNVEVVHARVGSTPGKCGIKEPNFAGNGNFGLVSTSDNPQQNPTQVLTLQNLYTTGTAVVLVDAPGAAKEVLEKFIPTLYRPDAPTLVVNADNGDDKAFLDNLARITGKALQTLRVPFFNPNNYHRKTENVFGGIAATFFVLASQH